MRLLIPLLILLIAGCQKEEGTGGLATIKGKVYGRDFRMDGTLASEGYIGDVRVYLTYGENPSLADDVRTSYTGDYEFKWLRPGNYSVYVLTDCDTCVHEQGVDLHRVEITQKRQVITLPDLIHKF